MSQIRIAWVLAVKDIRCFVRDRTALVLSLIVPIALVTVFGWIMAYAFGGGSGMPKAELHVADLAKSSASQSFIDALSGTDMVRVIPVKLPEAGAAAADVGSATNELEEQLGKLIKDGDAHHILVLPTDFDDALQAKRIPQFRMLRDPGRGMEEQIVQLAVMQATVSELGGSVFTGSMERMLAVDGMPVEQLESVLGWMDSISTTIGTFYEESDQDSEVETSSGAGTEADANRTGAAAASKLEEVGNENAPLQPATGAFVNEAAEESSGTAESSATNGFGIADFVSQMVPIENIDIKPPGRAQQVTFQQAQSVAGMTVMMLLFALTSCASVLLSEREQGTLKRLFMQPIGRNSILLGKFMFVGTIGLAQMTVLFLYGEWMFGVGLFRDPVTLLVLSCSWVAAGGAFGIFLASISRSTKQAESLASLLILVMAALGGCWFPLQLMNLPPLLELASKSTMTYWAMTGFQGMLWNQLPWFASKTLTALAWQWSWTLAFTVGAIFFFRRNFCRDVR